MKHWERLDIGSVTDAYTSEGSYWGFLVLISTHG
jgi:hypothetical protein